MQKQKSTRKKPRRRLNWRGVVVLLILTTAVATGLYFVLKPIVEYNFSAVNTLRALAFSAEEEHYYSGKGFFVIRGDNLQYLGLKDSKKDWSLKLAGSGYSISASPDLIAVYGQNVLQAADYNGNALFPSLEFTGTIVDVRCGKNYISALKLDPSGVYMIYIFNKKGERLDILQFTDSFPLSFGFYTPSDKLWTLALNTAGVTPITTITNYDATHSIVGSIPIDGQIANGVYMNGDKLYVPATDNMFVFDSAGKEIDRQLIYGYQALDFSTQAGKAVFLLANRSDMQKAGSTIGARLMYPDKDAKDAYFRLPKDTKNAFVCGETIVAITEESMYRFSLSGTQTDQMPMGVIVSEVEKLDERNLLFNCSGKMFLYTVK